MTEAEQPTTEVEQPSTEVNQPAPVEAIAATPSFSISPPQAVSRTILVVDDSPTVRKLITIKLEKEGHRVVPAVDGKDALAKLNEIVPDLIFTDITMPRMDGYQFCKLVRSDETTKHVPIIMLSGKDGFFDKVRGRMAGSTAYITKPFEPETLLKVVNDHCRAATSS
ncbi:MAG: response regulator [Pyrinomonadaceae bacterium]|nr:response regulator [Pyrinomonadaceae bacterium]